MEIKFCTSKEEWDSRLVSHSEHAPFTQSWAWGEILLAEGKKVERLAVIEGGEVIAQAQVVYNNSSFGWRYAFCPKGPVISRKSKVESRKLCELFMQYLKDKDVIFLRIEPPLPISNIQYPISKVLDINPRATTILDITKSEDDLLAAMHEKTRYNIRLAERKELKIVPTVSRDPAVAGKDLKVLMNLMKETGQRDKFKLHSEEHYRQILNSVTSSQLSVFYNGQPIAVGVFVGFADTFTYLYGASDYEHRSLMAPYLVQWEGIKLGKKLGYKYFDFFGIAPGDSRKSKVESRKDGEQILPVRGVGGCEPSGTKEYSYDPRHQYAGVTRFKLGFGGKILENPGTFDLIISPRKYKVYQILRSIRRLF